MANGRIAVVDIGSNTVRLVVYEVPTRLPFPLFNEKAQCELGRDLAETGRLNPDGVASALGTMARFVRLAEAMGVERLELVATAAVREAADGRDFVAEIEKRFSCHVDVIDGAEEARLSALGLLSGVPDADGLLGDIGGGSLDLVVLNAGSFGTYATLPFGHLRLSRSARTPKQAASLVAREMERLDWLDQLSGRCLYAAGGAWRAVARVFLEQTAWPLHVIDNFSLDRSEASALVRVVSRLSSDSWKRVPGISRRRLETLPYAAVVLDALLAAARPGRLVFSGFGMREGKMLQCLPETMRAQDPLIAGCSSHAERSGRFSLHGEEILTWMAPLFNGEQAAQARLRLAACLLSDIAWSVHPDYRAENAFNRVLRLPYAGLTHMNRIVLAIAVYVRYGGDIDLPLVEPARRLIDEETLLRAVTVGRALRLAHTLSGGAPGLLPRTRLRVGGDSLVLELPENRDVFFSEAVTRRLESLARRMGLKPEIA